jgi:hypothetical protein
MHGLPFNVSDLWELEKISDLADYYGALPSLSTALTDEVIRNSPGLIITLQSRDLRMRVMNVARRLHHGNLFREAMILLLNEVEAPYNLEHCVMCHHIAVSERFLPLIRYSTKRAPETQTSLLTKHQVEVFKNASDKLETIVQGFTDIEDAYLQLYIAHSKSIYVTDDRPRKCSEGFSSSLIFHRNPRCRHVPLKYRIDYYRALANFDFTSLPGGNGPVQTLPDLARARLTQRFPHSFPLHPTPPPVLAPEVPIDPAETSGQKASRTLRNLLGPVVKSNLRFVTLASGESG